MFFKHSTSGKIIILIVYVDDINLTGDNLEEQEQVKKVLAKEFEIKDLCQFRYFLGMEVARTKRGMAISQRKYTLNLLNEIGMLGCKPSETPIEANGKVKLKEKGDPVNRERYQRLVEKLKNLSHTRADIAFAVSVVSQYA